MKLYIDFDGVIVNTMEIIEQELKENNLKKTDEYYMNIDWLKLLNKCEIINSAFKQIEKLKSIFDISILTHIYTIEEGGAKLNFIRKYDKNLNVILVPKNIAKSKIVNAKNAILIDDYNENIKDWINNGGIGIKFNNKSYLTINTLAEINNYVKLCE